MSNRRSTVGLVMASWIVLTVTAMAQSKDDRQLPTGDVWITSEHPYVFYLQPKAKAPITGTAIADIWVVPDQDERSAQLKSKPQEQAKEPITSKN